MKRYVTMGKINTEPVAKIKDTLEWSFVSDYDSHIDLFHIWTAKTIGSTLILEVTQEYAEDDHLEYAIIYPTAEEAKEMCDRISDACSRLSRGEDTEDVFGEVLTADGFDVTNIDAHPLDNDFASDIDVSNITNMKVVGSAIILDSRVANPYISELRHTVVLYDNVDDASAAAKEITAAREFITRMVEGSLGVRVDGCVRIGNVSYEPHSVFVTPALGLYSIVDGAHVFFGNVSSGDVEFRDGFVYVDGLRLGFGGEENGLKAFDTLRAFIG